MNGNTKSKNIPLRWFLTFWSYAKQPKYYFALIVYLFSEGCSFMFCKPNEEYLEVSAANDFIMSELPDAQINGDGIGSKYESMKNSYGNIEDLSAVENINPDDDIIEKEQYDSKYSEEEADRIASDRYKTELRNLEEHLQRSYDRGNNMSYNSPSTSQQETISDLQRALSEARLAAQKPVATEQNQPVGTLGSSVRPQSSESPVLQERVGEGCSVVKKLQTKSDYFNTLTDNEADQKLIKAIIDENITAVDGSRVRLRLLDDVEINDVILYKGSYLYATMSGFGSQRVKGSIKSLMVEDDIVKVSLSIYDTDGLEGLYIPSSSFRDTGKDIASGVMSNTATLNSGTYANNFAQWGMQAAQNAYQQASSAISKAVKKNRAKLKYGTFVYLINSNSK